jgi:hypothetical protein
MDIWYGNDDEDYITVFASFVNAGWELKKFVIGFKLIQVSHNGVNIVERIVSMIQYFCMIDKVFSVTLVVLLLIQLTCLYYHLCLLGTWVLVLIQ